MAKNIPNVKPSTCKFSASRIGLMIVALAMAPTLGCGDSQSIMPVSGSVSLDGAKLDSGMVLFSPVESGRPGTSVILADGSFQLRTDGKFDGVSVGEYRVAVLPAGNAAPEEAIQPVAKNKKIPRRYSEASTSGLRYSVESGKTNEFDIELSSSPAKR